MLIFFLVYLLLCLLYLEKQCSHKNILLLIAASSKTSKNRLVINKELENINKQIKLFLLWPVLTTVGVVNEIKRNRS